VFFLKRGKDDIENNNIEWAPSEMQSRGIPKIRQHEKCSFPYIKMNEDKHLKVLGIDKKKKRGRSNTAGFDEETIHDEYDFNDDDDDMDYDIVEANDKEQFYQENQGYDEGNGDLGRSGYSDEGRGMGNTGYGGRSSGGFQSNRSGG
jgi:hypothetical protein